MTPTLSPDLAAQIRAALDDPCACDELAAELALLRSRRDALLGVLDSAEGCGATVVRIAEVRYQLGVR